jgi:hypothetical protein
MARDARRAARENEAAVVSIAIERIETHWHTVLAAHFEQEERLLKIAADALDPELVARILAEHAELRLLALGLREIEPAARLQRFGELLNAHVRYEERTLFPQLQLHPCVAQTEATAITNADVDVNANADG